MIAGFSFVALMLAAMPIAFVLLATTMIYVLVSGNTQILTAIPQIMFGSVESFDLLAIPLFVLLGEIMNESGLTRRIIIAARVWLARLPHNLVIVNLISNLALAAIMGSATAQMAVMSRVVVPEMEKDGYDRGYAASITASAGLLGPIIPPSMVFIIFGVIAQVSIADMFMAGIVPGMVLFALIMAIALFQAGRHRTPGHTGTPLPTGSRLRATLPGVATMLIPLTIIGGISGGVFTPTESAAVAIVVALIFGAVIFRELPMKSVPLIIDRTVTNTAIVLFLIMAAKVFGWVLTFNQIPQAVAAFIVSLTADPTMFMLLVVAALMVVGMFLDGIAALIILTPILLPVAVSHYGIDPIQFGVVMSLTLVLGLLTPPVGTGLYIAAAMSEIPITRLARLVLPYVAASLVVILLVVLVPWTVRPF
ncbi:MAG: TRAP transporter large permease [Paracoccus sp. (in: a-proteobacteria)]|uniref:TRAP transporter large permease n=1 Tax=Paracoccus sp. TaxID=267 RepID=UPI0026DEF589|nr:TRAP transporter large permease [Paracoccus sp. (in: a-proteobacteria)]MDO5620967.1 TRAP transporter large permease [Paracoccus sp. (in: a-proteobacteria)]